MTQKVFLDLDGVMADFDAHYPALFGHSQSSVSDDQMWSTINGHATFFEDMPPCPGALAFFKDIEKLDPIVLTGCPWSNYASAAKQKRAWVRKHLSDRCLVLPVSASRFKPLFMHAPKDILIDDQKRNTVAWHEAGGIAILHRDFETTGSALAAALMAPLVRSLVMAQPKLRPPRDITQPSGSYDDAFEPYDGKPLDLPPPEPGECDPRLSPCGTFVIHKDDCVTAIERGLPRESGPADWPSAGRGSAGRVEP